MSIYRYMADMVQDTLGNEPDFDPHAHRVIKHPTNYMDTMSHMLKGCIGAGILAMPLAVMKVGIILATILLIAVGAFGTYAILLLTPTSEAGQCATVINEASHPNYMIHTEYLLCKRHKRGYMAYPKAMLWAVKDGPNWFKFSGNTLYWFVESTLIIWQFGICTIYFVFVAENLKQVLDYQGLILNLRIWICILLPPMILLNLIRNLKWLAPLSTLSNVFTILGLLIVGFYLIEDDMDFTDDKMRMKKLIDIPCFVGTALFALEAVGVILALEYNMENPKEFGGLFGLFSIGMAIIVFMYLLAGIFGYVRFGDKVEASITLNLPQDHKKAIVAKILFALAIFMSFPLQNFVAYNHLWRRLLKKLGGNECPAGKRFFWDYFLRIFCVIVPWALAVAIPALGPFIALFGALCLSLLAFVFPAIMSLCVWYSEPEGYGPMKYKLIKDMFIMITGLVILIAGVFTSILDIIK